MMKRVSVGLYPLMCAGLMTLLFSPAATAQTAAELQESDDTRYYDFWPGTWAEVVDGRPDTTRTVFVVRRSVNPAAFEEDWRQVYDEGSHPSKALRGWDQVTGRWRFVWMSDNALFQVWEGEKIGNDWYILKEFLIDGQTILSRQAWIPTGENRLVRTLERSTDGGATWTTRSRQTYQRIAD